jgi:sialic acid synthase SpsE
MRTKICCELATGHGGNIETALKMIDAAAEAGADAVKIQHYGAVNPHDPQAEWLNQSRLHVDAIRKLQARSRDWGLEFWATPFNAESLSDLEAVGVDRIKIASSEAHAEWWRPREVRYVVSWPWGVGHVFYAREQINLTAIPLYPTPFECVARAPLLDGWSDHTVGLSACYHAISRGAQWLEVHLTLGEGQSRVMVWDKSPEDIRQLRQYADDVATMRTGVSQIFRDRWQKSV